MTPSTQPEASVIVISFNTRDLLRECLHNVLTEAGELPIEVLVVDNSSSDGSPEMVADEFPAVILLRSDCNLGFGAANNLALARARGRYFVLLNSDAFFTPGALARAIRHMDSTPACALGGALLVGRDGAHQPSARCFHSVTQDAVVLTGLAARFPRSRVFGTFDRTWADPAQPSPVDWVPGAFSIIRPDALRAIGLFDPSFFLYYEEVDLCRRFKAAGHQIWYWPDIVIIHIGGESSRKLKQLEFSTGAAQVVLWRMRSTMLYYRKHHGPRVHLARWMEHTLYTLTAMRNRFSRAPHRRERARHYGTLVRLLDQAWRDTRGGRVSPPRPW